VKPDGSLFTSHQEDMVIHPDTVKPCYQWGIGQNPGFWIAGVYRVVIHIDGVEFAEESFAVTSEGGTDSAIPPSQPSGRSGQPEEPPPTYIPKKTPAEKPPGNSNVAQPTTDIDAKDEAQSYQEGKVIDFTTYARKRREEAKPTHIPQEIPEGPVFRRRELRPPDIPIPRYEPLDYSSGPVTVQDFRDRLAPLVRAASVRHELLDSDVGDRLVVNAALALQDSMMGRRVLQRMLQRNCSRPSEQGGLLAVMLGQTAIAEQLIHDLEKDNGVYDELEAGAIAAKLPDRTEAYRLLRKFEEKGNQAAALHIAVEIGDGEAIKRVLVDILQYGNIDAQRGYFLHITELLQTGLNGV
jgi:hypothetical protein